MEWILTKIEFSGISSLKLDKHLALLEVWYADGKMVNFFVNASLYL